MATRSDAERPPLRLLIREGFAIGARVWRAFGHLKERGPEDGPKLLVVPGFLATDRTTLGLQRALAAAGYRVTGWGLGQNRGVRADTIDQLAAQVEAFGKGAPVLLVGWSLGGLYARELARQRPDLAGKVITLGSPFSGDPRANNVWRLYERVAGHAVDNPPIKTASSKKPPVPTLAIWSAMDGIVAPAATRGQPGESDRRVELTCSHMGYAVSGRAYPAIIAAIRDFA